MPDMNVPSEELTGDDRELLFDYHPAIRVILPTPEGVRSVRITDLMPLGAVWDPAEGTRDFDPGIFGRPGG